MKDIKKYNKALLIVEIAIGLSSAIALVTTVTIAAFLTETNFSAAILLIIISLASFIIICLALTKMEQIVGYYQCPHCRRKYIPSYNAVLWSMHLGRTRYLACPKCHKKSWQKKII